MANASQEYFNSNKQTMMARGSAASWNQKSLTRKNNQTLMNVHRNQSTRKSKHLLKCTQASSGEVLMIAASWFL